MRTDPTEVWARGVMGRCVASDADPLHAADRGPVDGRPAAVEKLGTTGIASGHTDPVAEIIEDLGNDVFHVDTRMGGYEGITSGYLIRSSRPCLVETGTARSADLVVRALAELGVDAGRPRHHRRHAHPPRPRRRRRRHRRGLPERAGRRAREGCPAPRRPQQADGQRAPGLRRRHGSPLRRPPPGSRRSAWSCSARSARSTSATAGGSTPSTIPATRRTTSASSTPRPATSTRATPPACTCRRPPTCGPPLPRRTSTSTSRCRRSQRMKDARREPAAVQPLRAGHRRRRHPRPLRGGAALLGRGRRGRARRRAQPRPRHRHGPREGPRAAPGVLRGRGPRAQVRRAVRRGRQRQRHRPLARQARRRGRLTYGCRSSSVGVWPSSGSSSSSVKARPSSSSTRSSASVTPPMSEAAALRIHSRDSSSRPARSSRSA